MESTRKESEYEKVLPMAMEGEKKLHINHSFKNRMGFFRSFFIFIERFLRLTAFFTITITGSIFLLTASFYLFCSAFGLKDSSSFQGLRERIAVLYSAHIEEAIREVEEHKNWKLKEGLKEMKENIEEKDEEEEREISEDVSESIQEQEQKQNQEFEELNNEIVEIEKELQEKKLELEKLQPIEPLLD